VGVAASWARAARAAAIWVLAMAVDRRNRRLPRSTNIGTEKEYNKQEVGAREKKTGTRGQRPADGLARGRGGASGWLG